MFKFDLQTYNLTKDLPGGPTLGVIEDDTPEFQVARDRHGNPTLGGIIGYSIAYALILGVIGWMFYVL